MDNLVALPLGARSERAAAISWATARTRSIRAAKRLLDRLLRGHSVGALTGRAAFPLMASALANRVD